MVVAQKKVQKPRKARTSLPVKDRCISMSNAVARGAQGLSLSQKRIVALAMAMTDSVPASDLLAGQFHGWTVRLAAHDYADTYEVSPDTAYRQLKEGCESLMRSIWSTVEQGRKGRIVTKGPWSTLAKYRDGEACVDLTFHHYVAPHLLALRSQFTTYKLKQAAALRSIYSWRLFECLQSWKDTGRWTPTIEEFHKAMEAPASCCADFGQLKRRVIDPAVKELRDKDGLLLEWSPVKAGRKVGGLDFRFTPDPQGRLNL